MHGQFKSKKRSDIKGIEAKERNHGRRQRHQRIYEIREMELFERPSGYIQSARLTNNQG